jgi:L-fuculose-phosphate aldolase
MPTELEDVQRQTAAANRILTDLGLAVGVTSALGHASMRVPSEPNKFVVKGREYELDALSEMQADDMVVCDTEGFKVGGRPELTQCSEIKIHSCIYKTQPQVNSVVHVHPRYTVLLSVLGVTIVPMCQEGAPLVRNPLKVYPHVKTIQTDEEGMDLAILMGSDKAILMLGHGAVTTGATLEESVTTMLQLEEQARMNYLAYSAAGRDYPKIPLELVDDMSNRQPLHELPHFKDVLEGRQPQRGGIWAYRVARIS